MGNVRNRTRLDQIAAEPSESQRVEIGDAATSVRRGVFLLGATAEVVGEQPWRVGAGVEVTVAINGDFSLAY